jgi:RES domain-containing protein
MSPLTVWRLCSVEYAATAFSGAGARLYGGRWSLPGLAAAYCAESRALAALEVLAHVDDPARLAERTWCCIPASFPAALVEKPARVPNSWRSYPYTLETQRFGSDWLREGRSLALRLPSALVPGEFNFLVNPAHAEFGKAIVGQPEPFTFDPRFAG